MSYTVSLYNIPFLHFLVMVFIFSQLPSPDFLSVRLRVRVLEAVSHSDQGPFW